MLSLISPSPPLLHFTTNKATLQNFIIPSTSSNTRGSRGRWVPRTVTRVSSSDETKVATASIPTTTTTTKVNVVDDDEDVVVESAEEVVRKFYDGINGRDLTSVEDLIASNCVYEDLIFATPFVGRKVQHISQPIFLQMSHTLPHIRMYNCIWIFYVSIFTRIGKTTIQ